MSRLTFFSEQVHLHSDAIQQQTSLWHKSWSHHNIQDLCCSVCFAYNHLIFGIDYQRKFFIVFASPICPISTSKYISRNLQNFVLTLIDNSTSHFPEFDWKLLVLPTELQRRGLYSLYLWNAVAFEWSAPREFPSNAANCLLREAELGSIAID